LAICHRWRNGQLPGLANAHVQQALVPALDDLMAAEGEVEGGVAVVARVKLGAVLQRALVHHRDLVAIACLARAVDGAGDLDVEVLRPCGRSGQRDEQCRGEAHGGRGRVSWRAQS
jgi:hypothetical protein